MGKLMLPFVHGVAASANQSDTTANPRTGGETLSPELSGTVVTYPDATELPELSDHKLMGRFDGDAFALEGTVQNEGDTGIVLVPRELHFLDVNGETLARRTILTERDEFELTVPAGERREIRGDLHLDATMTATRFDRFRQVCEWYYSF